MDSLGSGNLIRGIKTTPADLIRAAKEHSLEGIIAKRKDSLYEPGKGSGAWLKYRINRGQEFVIGGYTPDHPFDALIVGYYEGEKLYYVGKVRNGFVPQVSLLSGHRTVISDTRSSSV